MESTVALMFFTKKDLYYSSFGTQKAIGSFCVVETTMAISVISFALVIYYIETHPWK